MSRLKIYRSQKIIGIFMIFLLTSSCKFNTKKSDVNRVANPNRQLQIKSLVNQVPQLASSEAFLRDLFNTQNLNITLEAQRIAYLRFVEGLLLSPEPNKLDFDISSLLLSQFIEWSKNFEIFFNLSLREKSGLDEQQKKFISETWQMQERIAEKYLKTKKLSYSDYVQYAYWYSLSLSTRAYQKVYSKDPARAVNTWHR